MHSVKLEKLDKYRWIIQPAEGMHVPGIIYASEEMIDDITRDNAHIQVANVAQMPGIIKASLAMPDIHWGYGFPIGGCAAFDIKEGVISPGGVGYDINCGVRLLRTDLTREEIEKRIRELIGALFNNIPTGVGSKGDLRLTLEEEKMVLKKGARWAVEKGFGYPEDLERIEENGAMDGADPDAVSQRALERGREQLGTAGSGNHFVEIGYVEEIYNEKVAEVFGLRLNQITVLIHTGSRGFGYQVCDDYLKILSQYVKKTGITLPDKQLACSYFDSPEGQNYYRAMICAVNYAFANRQMITHWTRETFEKVLRMSPSDLNMRLVYDVAHNVAKVETHIVDGKPRKVIVHRKGATRAFPAGRPDVPEIYRDVGQPVLIPGDMGRCSYVLVGTEKAMEETFGTTCHGAGRVLSRTQAIKSAKGRSIKQELEEKGIIVLSQDKETLAEEMSDAYKDVSKVVDVVHMAGISRKVAKIRPLGCIKG